MLQTLRGKQKYQVTNVGVEKIKLSRLLVQCIDQGRIQEFLKRGVVRYQSNLEHQWCGRRVTTPASGAIS